MAADSYLAAWAAGWLQIMLPTLRPLWVWLANATKDARHASFASAWQTSIDTARDLIRQWRASQLLGSAQLDSPNASLAERSFMRNLLRARSAGDGEPLTDKEVISQVGHSLRMHGGF